MGNLRLFSRDNLRFLSFKGELDINLCKLLSFARKFSSSLDKSKFSVSNFWTLVSSLIVIGAPYELTSFANETFFCNILFVEETDDYCLVLTTGMLIF
jgi:hypothetical protein